MEDKKRESQRRASANYYKKRAQIKITVSKEQRERWQAHAEMKQTNLTALITELIEKDITGGK